ncbi:hypothetical protein BCR37DRAFT_384536 [Protomyces lactucae-debilis]|uniref:F-box domain-containing protein n=1 Tax=Protomyces lactucae-debilis TaxID=2754530 RepID=A0A1Y2ERE1_PROLT|nr:uncharacterized protein BCR37DRAFT_384536 [Protomyces lactucae-debilis]ORY74109.1 hypothetical protein BCR37DRAFT_384536 [Protomyces lactucae-debilis]
MPAFASFPDELLLQIFLELDYESQLSLGRCSRALQLFLQDSKLFEDTLRKAFPLAHARVARSVKPAQHGSLSRWEHALRSCVAQQRCCTQRKALQYRKTKIDQLLPFFPARPPIPGFLLKVLVNYGKLVCFVDPRETGIDRYVRILDLGSGEIGHCDLGDGHEIRAVVLSAEHVHVVAVHQDASMHNHSIFTFDFQAKLTSSFTITCNTVQAAAASQHFLFLSCSRGIWIQCDVYKKTYLMLSGASALPRWPYDRLFCAADKDYLYVVPRDRAAMCWDLHRECWSPLDIKTTNCNLYSSGNFVYCRQDDQLCILHGTEKTFANGSCPGSIFDSHAICPILDIGGFAAWQGDEETNYGLYSYTGLAQAMKEPGRLMGPGESRDQIENMNVRLSSDHNWLVLYDMYRIDIQAWYLGGA